MHTILKNYSKMKVKKAARILGKTHPDFSENFPKILEEVTASNINLGNPIDDLELAYYRVKDKEFTDIEDVIFS